MMSKKALVVDNDFYFVEFLSEFVEGWGYEVLKCYDGAQALLKLDQEKFDVVFLDLVMPGINGKQLIKYIRSKYGRPPFYVIALPVPEQMDGPQESGADYCVAKESVGRTTEHLHRLMGEIEKGEETDGERVFQSRDLTPRFSTDELVQMINFQEAVIEKSGMGTLVVDPALNVIHFNPSACEMTGRAYHELLGQPVSLIFPSDAERVNAMLGRLLRQTGAKRISHVVRVDSREIHMVASLLTICGRAAGCVLTLAHV